MLTAILAVLLFLLAAIAVELTDLYSRDRASQTVADVSALAGAQGLPDACAAATEALTVLNDGGNSVRNDAGANEFTATAAQMSDGDLTNGEIQVLSGYDRTLPLTAPGTGSWISTAGCGATGGTDTARAVRVVTPPREVDFTFAAVSPAAPDSGNARAVATAEIRSPQIGDTLPVFLPTTCDFGANYVITDSPSASGGGTPNYRPNGATPSRSAPVIQSVTSSVVSGGLVQRVLVTVTGLAEPASLTSVRFDFHTGSGGSTVRFPVLEAASVAPLALTTPSPETLPPYSAVYEVELDVYITSRGGSWFVRATETIGANVGEYTKVADAKPFSVEATAAPGCGDPSTGDFGLLRADREGTGSSFELAKNFITGIDFSISTIPTLPPPGTPCTADGAPTTALLSTTNPARDGANCLAIESGGTRGPVTDGLVAGADGLNGRLYAASSPSVPSGCDEPAGPGDAVNGDHLWRTPVNPSNPRIWNTQLSCYLPGGESLGDLRTCDGCLDAAIVEDPRYFLVPVLNTVGRPSSSTQWPVKEFRGAFITNEVDGAPATCASSGKCNGIEFNTGESTVFALQVFVFPLSALPDEVPTTTGDGTDYTGSGPREFVLVE